jgi:hypothetical protein
MKSGWRSMNWWGKIGEHIESWPNLQGSTAI